MRVRAGCTNPRRGNGYTFSTSLTPIYVPLSLYFPSQFDSMFSCVQALLATAGYLRFHPMAQCVVHALKACRARVTQASSHCRASRAQPELSAHIAFAPRARLRQAFSRTLRSEEQACARCHVSCCHCFVQDEAASPPGVYITSLF